MMNPLLSYDKDLNCSTQYKPSTILLSLTFWMCSSPNEKKLNSFHIATRMLAFGSTKHDLTKSSLIGTLFSIFHGPLSALKCINSVNTVAMNLCSLYFSRGLRSVAGVILV